MVQKSPHAEAPRTSPRSPPFCLPMISMDIICCLGVQSVYASLCEDVHEALHEVQEEHEEVADEEDAEDEDGEGDEEFATEHAAKELHEIGSAEDEEEADVSEEGGEVEQEEDEEPDEHHPEKELHDRDHLDEIASLAIQAAQVP
eukprot:gnl/TRDRNA2_/TRDRNA2_79802_c0_seq2.p1 gnl/TRDRNA2_/TRDRNA2_79802_c0~~gnl/TRDRNA2_/TRDRNA2_79802_c0_seq2.p1  ORF type:complete len:166 (-),score=41.24 gnl/TRDRNA2_/TRDRNA2_79802_c0_seq2:37-471(-)